MNLKLHRLNGYSMALWALCLALGCGGEPAQGYVRYQLTQVADRRVVATHAYTRSWLQPIAPQSCCDAKSTHYRPVVRRRGSKSWVAAGGPPWVGSSGWASGGSRLGARSLGGPLWVWVA